MGKDSETRYRRLFEAARDGILILDAESGMIIDVNPFLIEILGYSKEQFLEKKIWEIEPFKNIVENQSKFSELQQKEFVRYENLPLETADGQKKNVEFVSNGYLVNSHKVIQCNIRDVTERAERESLQSLLKEILGILNNPLPLQELIIKIIKSIQQATQFSAVGIRLKKGDDFPYFAQNGFSNDFLLTENTLTVKGKDAGICRDSSGKPLLECTCGMVINGKTDRTSPFLTEAGSFWTNDSYPLLELTLEEDPRLNRRNNCIHHGFGSVALIPIRTDNSIVGILQLNEKRKDAFTNDLIRFFEGMGEIIGIALMRKQAEEALRENEEKYRTLFDNVQDVFYQIDLDGIIQEISQSIIFFTEFNRVELLNTKVANLYYYPDDREFFLSAIKKNGEVRDFEIMLKTKNGVKKFASVNARIIPDANGKPKIINGSLRDITERKRAEEELKLKNEQLNLANAEKDKFFSIIAHDLRSPFNSLLGFTQLLVEEMPALTRDQIQQIAVTMRKSTTNLYALLENLLEWSRLQRGLITFNPEQILLKPKVLADTVIGMESANKKGITFNYDIPGDLKVFTDENMLGGILRNLTSNAVKFTPKGGKVTISAKSLYNTVECSVSDTGIGMNSEMKENLFNINFNSSRKGTEKEPSTGLGLIICREFVEKHGGTLSIESDEGKGSTFYFTLPSKAKE